MFTFKNNLCHNKHVRNKKAFASVEILIVILIIAVVGVGFYFVGKNSNTPLISQPTPEAMDEISDWKTYSGESLLFKYQENGS